jgi:hypothetical protein
MDQEWVKGLRFLDLAPPLIPPFAKEAIMATSLPALYSFFTLCGRYTVEGLRINEAQKEVGMEPIPRQHKNVIFLLIVFRVLY